MLNQMVKWTVLIGLWRKYKRHASVTVLCLLGLILITLFHQDFIEFHDKSQTPYLALSYAVKWGAYLLCIVVYWLLISKINRAAKFDSTLHAIMQAKSASQTNNSASAQANDTSEHNGVDPFAQLRQKKKLRSKADIILENKNNR